MLHSITMKAFKVILITTLCLLLLGATGLYLAGRLSPKPGGVRIETTPESSVFINGVLVGETPYRGSYKAGTVVLKLVPKGTVEEMIPFETTLTLASGIETVVGRNFAATEDASSGYVITFEKTKNQTASLIVFSQPTNAQVLVDGVSRGFSPYDVSSISPANHAITVKSPGYKDFSMTIKTLVGYRLNFYAKLASGSGVPEKKQEEGLTTVKKVTVLDTPTGYLRVRSQPGSGGDEIAQVRPGDSFLFLDTDIASGWIEIQYEASKAGLPAGITGWISGEYATISAEKK